MKRFLLICLSAVSLLGCKFTEDDVFDRSPGQRFEQTTNEYERILVGQEHGWLMEYYAGDGQRYGGYNFVLRFLNGHQVAAVSELSTTEYTSQYSIDAVDGGAIPSLTFDTFSEVLHSFATPSPQDIKGKGGDFEFNLSYQDGVFILKGKKWGNEIRLTPFVGEQQAFFNTIKEKQNALTFAAFTPLTIDGRQVEVKMDLDNRRLSFTNEGTTVKRAFILTEKGLKLYKPLSIGSVRLEELVFSDDGSTLTTPDGSLSTQLVFLPDAINLNELQWNGYWIEGFTSQSFLDKFASIRSEESSYYSGNYTSDRAFKLGKTTSGRGLEMSKTSHRDREAATFPAAYLFDFYAVPGETNQVEFRLKTSGKNWKYFSDMYPLVSELTKHSPYIVTDVTLGGETYKKFTSTVDAEVWFHMRSATTLPEIMTAAWTIDFYNGWMSQDLLDTFAAASSTTYTTSAFAKLGLLSKWTSIQFTLTNTGGSQYYCIYLLDIVPVFGKADALHILDRRAGYNFKYFTHLKPVVDKLLEASPYELVPLGSYMRLMGGSNRSTWLYKHS